MEGELTGKTTFDNQPLEMDWDNAVYSEGHYEIPLLSPLNGFVPKYQDVETRLLVPCRKMEEYSFMTLDTEEIIDGFRFSELSSDTDETSLDTYRYMNFSKDLQPGDFVYKRATASDPNAYMPVQCEPATIIYYEKDCTWISNLLQNCSGWREVGRQEIEICGTDGIIGGNYNEYYIVKRDSTFIDTKADCIYEKLRNSSEGFKKMIQKFDYTFSVSDLLFTQNNNLPSGNYGRVLPPQNGNITVEFSNMNLGMISDLGSAVSFAHEIIHAEIYRKMLSAAKTGSLDPNNMSPQQQIDYVNNLRQNFPGLYDYYIDRFKPTWNHNMMAQHYIHSISNIIKEFDNNRLPSQVYDDISWAGLKILEDESESIAWSNLSGTDQDRILLNLNNYFHNGPSTCN
nr:hypothetical protein [Algoriphagus locisalis]